MSKSDRANAVGVMPVSSRQVSIELNDSSEWSSMNDEDKRIAALGYKPVRSLPCSEEMRRRDSSC